MRTNRGKFREFPYEGSFYKMNEPDYTVPLDQRVETETLVLTTKCDIQEVSKAANPVLIASFSVFFPWDVDVEIPLRRGMRFQGNMDGIDVSGMVTNVVLSQIGGIVAYVKDYDADETSV